MQYLKADTNTEVLIGPVVAVGDGFTPVTTLSLSTADEAEIIKYGGATPLTVTSISANGFAAITGADGYYTLDITTGNSDTEGFLTVLINDDSLCLPVRVDFMVVNANVYDSLFAAATTDYLQVDTIQVSGTAQTANDNGADINAILVDTNELQTDDIPTTLATLATSAALATAQADLDTITGSDGVTLATAQALYAPSKAGDSMALTAGAVDAIWDEPTAGHVTASTTGVALTDILADTNELQTDDIPTTLATLATSAALATVDTNVDAILVDTGTTIPGTITTLQADTDDIQTRLPAALVGGRMDSDIGAISTSTAAADNLEASALSIVIGACEGTPSTTVIQTDLAEATDDHYIGRVVVFTSGVCQYQATDITDYTGATGTITVTALTDAPSAADTFVVI